MKIGKKNIGNGKPVFIVAEIGINHNGDIEIAKKMIKIASECGADAVKFQTIIPDEFFSEKNNQELYELSKKWVFNYEQHKLLKRFAEKSGIEFFSTPFGKKSLNILKQIDVKILKISSGDLDNMELITTAAKTGIPLIISTGMSTLSEIQNTADHLSKMKCNFVLLHCNSSYPSPVRDANLSTIPFFKKIFSVPVGYSDHTLGIDACLSAVSMGASIIEKHFTLDKKMEGPDQKLSANPKELKEMISKIRTIEKLIGTPRSGITQSEKKFRKSMRKSIHSVTYIKKGTTIKKSMLTLFRPGDGIPPSMIPNLVGMKIKKDVKKGIKLRHDMFYK